MQALRTIEWVPCETGSLIPGKVRLIDQTRLPGELTYVETDDVEEDITSPSA